MKSVRALHSKQCEPFSDEIVMSPSWEVACLISTRPFVRPVKDIETLRARVDELEYRVNAALEGPNRKLATSKGSQAENPGQN